MYIAIQNNNEHYNTKFNCWLQYKMQLYIPVKNVTVDSSNSYTKGNAHCNRKFKYLFQYKIQLYIARQNATVNISIQNAIVHSSKKCNCRFIRLQYKMQIYIPMQYSIIVHSKAKDNAPSLLHVITQYQ